MNKQETTKELNDFLDFNQSDIEKLYDTNTELANAFGVLFNAVSNEYGSGEDFTTQFKNLTAPAQKSYFKVGDIVVFLTSVGSIKEGDSKTKALPGVIGEIVEDVSDINVESEGSYFRIQSGNDYWVNKTKINDMPTIRLADSIEAEMYRNSSAPSKPSIDVNDPKSLVGYTLHFSTGEWKVVEFLKNNPKNKRYRLEDLTKRKLVEYDISMSIVTRWLKGEKVKGSSGTTYIVELQSNYSAPAPAKQNVSAFPIKVGDYFRNINWYTSDYVLVEKITDDEIIGVDEDGISFSSSKSSFIHNYDIGEVKVGPTIDSVLMGRTVTLDVETLPAQLNYQIGFEKNKGGRQSPSQSAGDLYRAYKNNKEIYDELISTYFKGNDGKWWKLINQNNTWVWRKPVPQPQMPNTRRPGDVESIYSNTHKSRVELDWEPKYNLDEMMESAWKWENNLKKQ